MMGMAVRLRCNAWQYSANLERTFKKPTTTQKSTTTHEIRQHEEVKRLRLILGHRLMLLSRVTVDRPRFYFSLN
jgi:hypothetical protein